MIPTLVVHRHLVQLADRRPRTSRRETCRNLISTHLQTKSHAYSTKARPARRPCGWTRCAKTNHYSCKKRWTAQSPRVQRSELMHFSAPAGCRQRTLRQ
ncbi:hypothetical protein EIQ03_18895 [Xanthomonas campestris pv. raphani]